MNSWFSWPGYRLSRIVCVNWGLPAKVEAFLVQKPVWWPRKHTLWDLHWKGKRVWWNWRAWGVWWRI